MSLPQPLDLTKSDFHLWDFLKENVYKPPHTHTHARAHTLEKRKKIFSCALQASLKKTLKHSASYKREMANACTSECEWHFSTSYSTVCMYYDFRNIIWTIFVSKDGLCNGVIIIVIFKDEPTSSGSSSQTKLVPSITYVRYSEIGYMKVPSITYACF